ncbi:hypothetical protein DFH09DRAFT_1079028 [Mycena vulgaris]|nr:hypothetical protein DFH09DRAFT_1079028 [Mycena vulgaris]
MILDSAANGVHVVDDKPATSRRPGFESGGEHEKIYELDNQYLEDHDDLLLNHLISPPVKEKTIYTNANWYGGCGAHESHLIPSRLGGGRLAIAVNAAGESFVPSSFSTSMFSLQSSAGFAPFGYRPVLAATLHFPASGHCWHVDDVIALSDPSLPRTALDIRPPAAAATMHMPPHLASIPLRAPLLFPGAAGPDLVLLEHQVCSTCRISLDIRENCIVDRHNPVKSPGPPPAAAACPVRRNNSIRRSLDVLGVALLVVKTTASTCFALHSLEKGCAVPFYFPLSLARFRIPTQPACLIHTSHSGILTNLCRRHISTSIPHSPSTRPTSKPNGARPVIYRRLTAHPPRSAECTITKYSRTRRTADSVIVELFTSSAVDDSLTQHMPAPKNPFCNLVGPELEWFAGIRPRNSGICPENLVL